jgi:hypothetical protein
MSQSQKEKKPQEEPSTQDEYLIQMIRLQNTKLDQILTMLQELALRQDTQVVEENVEDIEESEEEEEDVQEEEPDVIPTPSPTPAPVKQHYVPRSTKRPASKPIVLPYSPHSHLRRRKAVQA